MNRRSGLWVAGRLLVCLLLAATLLSAAATGAANQVDTACDASSRFLRLRNRPGLQADPLAGHGHVARGRFWSSGTPPGHRRVCFDCSGPQPRPRLPGRDDRNGATMVLTVVTSPSNWAQMDKISSSFQARRPSPRFVGRRSHDVSDPRQGRLLAQCRHPLHRAHKPRGALAVGLSPGVRAGRLDSSSVG